MPDLLTLASLFLFQADIDNLGSRSFHAREAASAALRGNPLAVPALIATLRTSRCPEQHRRADLALAGLPDRLECHVFLLRHGDLRELAEYLAGKPEELTNLCDWIDRRELTCYGMGCERWARAMPFMRGSLAGDVEYVLLQARTKLKPAGVTLPVRYSWPR